MKQLELFEPIPGLIHIEDTKKTYLAIWIEKELELLVYFTEWENHKNSSVVKEKIPIPSREDLFRYFQENDMVIARNV